MRITNKKKRDMADKFLDKAGLAYFWEKIKAYFQSQHITPPEYTIVRLANEEVGYAASYVLKKDGTQVGATINIPKDYLVRSGEVKTVTVADEPYEGAVVGDKYLDFVVNTVDDSGNTSHIYIPVSDLVDAYVAGNGIQINESNFISVKVDPTNSNGLGVGGSGVAMYVVTPSASGIGGTNGAMLATDKEKLDKLQIVGVFTSDSDTDPVVEGNDGLVPSPTWAERYKFLRGDGTWDNPSSNCKTLQTAVGDPTASGTSIEFVSNITQNENGEISPSKKAVRTMVASGQNHASGLVPDPGSTAGTTRYLCENGTWSEPNGGGGGSSTPTDVQINGVSITNNDVANIQTEGTYDATSNKIATMEDLPTVNDAVLTIQRNSVTVGTFSSDASTPTNVNITVPTKTSDITNDSAFITSADVPSPASSAPLMDGVAAVGTSTLYSRGDHVHPTDTSRAADDAVVHKSGAETVSGAKTFTSNLTLSGTATLNFETSQDAGIYVEATVDTNNVKELNFCDIEDDSQVRLTNVATPVQSTDAVNKAYVDNLSENCVVKLNGYSGAYGITPLSLCAFAVWQGGSTSTMESLTTSGGLNGKPPVTSASPTISFPIGCKIYYHSDATPFTSSTAFTSKNFYATYDDVDARYTAVTGSSISLGSQSTSSVYLHVLVDNGYWKPYYKSGVTTEIIVTSNNLVSDNFYIYLGKTVGSTGYKFQLEDNNPLYYYDGENLIDWATYQASEAAPSYTAGDGISIINGVISCTPKPYKKEFLTTASFNTDSVYQKGWQNFVASSNLEVGTYKVTLQVHLYIVSNADNMMPAGCVVNVYMRSKATASSSYQYILGATETFSGGVLPETSIPTGRGIMSKVLNVVGFMEITGNEDSNCSLEVGFTTNSSLNVSIGNQTPLDGSYTGSCSGNDFVLLEKIA